ncbi:MAG: carboxypeptidase-like regulatory domain-containing protein [Lewinellaceae bacterium]|nr:carboxypeptidase-like regulatory domain-containing protein [Lewinellaceae bacterium]
MSLRNNTGRLSLLLLFCCVFAPLLRADDILERVISVRYYQTPVREVLADVAQKGGFEWSYNAAILDETKIVDLVADGWTVREILTHVLGDAYTFKQNGEYLILKKQKRPKPRLSGYISDQRTGQRMANVTVYDRQTLRSTVTDRHGYYELPVTPLSEVVVSKLAYRDTILKVNSQSPRIHRLELYADSLPAASTRISFRRQMNRLGVRLEQFFVGSAQKLTNLNVRDSLHRRFQVSFLPGLGSNHRLSGSVTNDWSLNILAGYSRGNRVFELGGLGNINREDMQGLQAAGLFNITGGHAYGMQLAGLFNNLGGNAAGLQAAGLYNFAGDTVQAMQLGGIVNYAGRSQGAIQAAGILNLSARGNAPVQIAGIGNHSHITGGVQIGGIFNSADTLRGCQIAGISNRARVISGVQIGLINVARQIDGVQIGLINYAQHGGYMVLELGANDIFSANAAFKSGVPALYTILTAGADPQSPSDNRVWAYGAGLGSRIPLTNWAGLSVDLVHRHLNEGRHDNLVQEWEQLALGLDLNLGRHFSIAGGPTANLFITDPDNPGPGDFRERIGSKNWLDDNSNADGWLSAWGGWHAALRVRF